MKLKVRKFKFLGTFRCRRRGCSMKQCSNTVTIYVKYIRCEKQIVYFSFKASQEVWCHFFPLFLRHSVLPPPPPPPLSVAEQLKRWNCNPAAPNSIPALTAS